MPASEDFEGDLKSFRINKTRSDEIVQGLKARLTKLLENESKAQKAYNALETKINQIKPPRGQRARSTESVQLHDSNEECAEAALLPLAASDQGK